MSFTFDATMKGLGGQYPRDYAVTFDGPTSLLVKALNVDLSTFTAAADLVLGLGDPLQEIVHVDFQSAAVGTKPVDVLAYNTALFRHYKVPVHSIVVLLRPAAAHSKVNGTVSYASRPGRGKIEFNYELVAIWKRPVEELLAGAVGTLPLAMLGKLPEGVDLVAGLTGIVQRLIERLEAEVPAEQVKDLLTAAYLLTGLRVQRDVSKGIFTGARAMRESDTYMAILEEGEERQARKAIQRLGPRFLGAPTEPILTHLQSIADLARLERILDRVMDAKNWDDLLNTP